MDDMMFTVCEGDSRLSKRWENTNLTWGELVRRLSVPKRTKETLAEYMAMSRDEQSKRKDVGGIVCGSLKHDITSNSEMAGRKTKENIQWRSIVTLDIDDCPEGYNPIVVIADELPGVEAFAHTTHKHSPEHPRWRVFIPLSEWMTPFYYEAIARKIGDIVGMDVLDKSTFQPNRLMYFPSASRDGEFLIDRVYGRPISPSKFFQEFPALKRESAWPRHPMEEPVQRRSVMTEREGEYNEAGKPVLPVEKDGVIGAFIKAYPIEDAIATFLPDVYIPVGLGRYTYANGSSEGGLVIYDGMFAYSNHATDPAANGHDNNAFDLVRIHKYGYLDGKAAKTTRNDRLPSYKAMCELCLKDKRVNHILASERAEQMKEDFDGIDTSKDEMIAWMEDLEKTKSGAPKDTNRNQDIIIMNDAVLRGVRYDEFRRINTLDDPKKLHCSSRRVNDEALRNIATRYEERYNLKLSLTRVSDILAGTQSRRGYNPVHDFILQEQWDGTPRVDELLIRCLGADDTELNRAQTRAWMVGAVKRAFEPGCKFDYMLVLTGPQGIGKSTFLWALANRGEFLNESLQLDMRGRDMIEQLNSGWIFEIAELGGLKSVKETDKVKAFISVTEDRMRKAYGHEVEFFPRHCALAASTNDTTFLSDSDSRKFWVILVSGAGNWEWVSWLEDNVGQIWAEAHTYYRQGQQSFLAADLEKKAREIQSEFNTVNDNEILGLIGAYLDYKLPVNWYLKSKKERENYIREYSNNQDVVLYQRNRICVAEIKTELPECKNYTAQFINKRILPNLGWELQKSGRKCRIDDIYGTQRNVFYRHGTDGTETAVGGIDNEDDDEL